MLIFGMSQSSTTAEAGRDLLIIQSTAPAQPGTAGAGCPGLCPELEYVLRWRLHHLSGKPVFGHPNNAKLFPDIQKKPPVFQFVPFTSCTATGHHSKPGSVFFVLPIQVIFTHQQQLP